MHVALCLFTFILHLSPLLSCGAVSVETAVRVAARFMSVICLQVWEHLSVMAERRPIAGNKGGSALTMFSSSGLVFGVLQVSPRLRSVARCTWSPHLFRSPTLFLAAWPCFRALCHRQACA